MSCRLKSRLEHFLKVFEERHLGRIVFIVVVCAFGAVIVQILSGDPTSSLIVAVSTIGGAILFSSVALYFVLSGVHNALHVCRDKRPIFRRFSEVALPLFVAFLFGSGAVACVLGIIRVWRR